MPRFVNHPPESLQLLLASKGNTQIHLKDCSASRNSMNGMNYLGTKRGANGTGFLSRTKSGIAKMRKNMGYFSDH